MKKLAIKLTALKNTSGQDLVEYVLMAGFIAVTAGAIMPGGHGDPEAGVRVAGTRRGARDLCAGSGGHPEERLRCIGHRTDRIAAGANQ